MAAPTTLVLSVLIDGHSSIHNPDQLTREQVAELVAASSSFAITTQPAPPPGPPVLHRVWTRPAPRHTRHPRRRHSDAQGGAR